jgi:hypothetical protein
MRRHGPVIFSKELESSFGMLEFAPSSSARFTLDPASGSGIEVVVSEGNVLVSDAGELIYLLDDLGGQPPARPTSIRNPD